MSHGTEEAFLSGIGLGVQKYPKTAAKIEPKMAKDVAKNFGERNSVQKPMGEKPYPEKTKSEMAEVHAIPYFLRLDKWLGWWLIMDAQWDSTGNTWKYLPAIPFRQKLRLSMLGGQNMIYQSGFHTKSSAIDTHTVSSISSSLYWLVLTI
jgi:hypothetical protein